MRVLVACEFSGRVRDAFIRRGHSAVSCDKLPTEVAGPHIQKPIESVDPTGYDLLIAHPPCTYLAVSAARWFERNREKQEEALEFVRLLMDLPIPRKCIENPISVISTRIRKSDQIVHPWMFGHGEVKATCLWLENLPCLVPTDVVEGRAARVHHEPPSEDRWKNRSRTYEGIADAMAAQWGGLV